MKQSYIEIKSLDFMYSVYSDWGIIKHRVHQGSILGCLLFLIYRWLVTSHQDPVQNFTDCGWYGRVSKFVNLCIQDFELLRSPVLILLFQTFCDWFQQIGMMSCDWQVGFPHSSAVAQIAVESVNLVFVKCGWLLSCCSEWGWLAII